MASVTPSPSLRRAATAESERIGRALAVLEQRRAAVRAQLAELDQEAAQLEGRRALLAQLTEAQPAPAGAAAEAAPPPAGRVLKGRELRRVAGRLLWESQGPRELHYREWFERVLAAGYLVGGKDPVASFLTNVRDSPAVVSASGPGYYRLDPGRREPLAQQRDEVRAELDDVAAVLERARAQGAPVERIEQLRAHRERLAARRRRLDGELAELDAIFDGAARDAADPTCADELRAIDLRGPQTPARSAA